MRASLKTNSASRQILLYYIIYYSIDPNASQADQADS